MNDPHTAVWCVYILQCDDGSLYTGCTNNLAKRIIQHRSGKGAKYTRSHLPIKLAYSELTHTKSLSLKREHQIKKLSHEEKKKLCGL